MHRLWILLGALVATASAFATPDTDYEADVAFALDQIEEKCGHFFKPKGIDWKKVRKEFEKAAREVKTDQDHLVLMWRLLARLEDGHVRVETLAKGKGVKWPEEEPRTGPGFFLCRSKKKVLIKNAWSAAASSGLEAGMEVLKVDGVKVDKWLEERIAKQRDMTSFSTDHHAFFHACHWGLAEPVGTRIKLEVKTPDGKKKKRTVTYSKASTTAQGPAFFPAGLKGVGDGQKYGTTKNGYSYIHLRRVPTSLPEEMDELLAGVGNPPGLILDFRGNSGGGCDHDAFFGRLLPEGVTFDRPDAYPLPSVGPNPYAGPIVVIVDATVRSSGETLSGTLSEDGRAYMIGESPTAGMASQKEYIELPSRLFRLRVSIGSNKGRFNRGKGIEGIGVTPHEIVQFEAKDLAAGVDTLIRRAEELLADFPQEKVRYDPKDFDWRPSER